MWCDLRSEKTHHIVKIDILSYWYHVKVWIIPLSRTFYLDLLWYWHQKLLMFKAIKYKNKEKTLQLWCWFPLLCNFTFCDMWQVSQITSHIVKVNWMATYWLTVWFCSMGLVVTSFLISKRVFHLFSQDSLFTHEYHVLAVVSQSIYFPIIVHISF